MTDVLSYNHCIKIIHAPLSATHHFLKTGSSQIMMNISEHGNFSNSLRLCLSASLHCLSILYIYLYINIFNYNILQYIIEIYIYPRWLGMLIVNIRIKSSGFHYNLSLKHKKKQAKTHHLLQRTIQQESGKTHQTNPAPQASQATQIKCNCKEFKKTQRQYENIASIISVSQYLFLLYKTWLT